MHFRVASAGEINLFENYSYSIGPGTEKNLKKQLHNKLKYKRMTNAIL